MNLLSRIKERFHFTRMEHEEHVREAVMVESDLRDCKRRIALIEAEIRTRGAVNGRRNS